MLGTFFLNSDVSICVWYHLSNWNWWPGGEKTKFYQFRTRERRPFQYVRIEPKQSRVFASLSRGVQMAIRKLSLVVEQPSGSNGDLSTCAISWIVQMLKWWCRFFVGRCRDWLVRVSMVWWRICSHISIAVSNPHNKIQNWNRRAIVLKRSLFFEQFVWFFYRDSQMAKASKTWL